MEAYELIIHFKSPTMTAREYLDFSKNILIRLAEFDSIFRDLFGWGTKANARRQIDPSLNDFYEIVFKQIEDKTIAYENPDPDNKNFTLDSKCFIGYGNSYSNTTRKKDGQITVSIEAGKDTQTGILIIEFPECNFIRFNEYAYVRSLFQKCIQMLNPVYGYIISDAIIELNNADRNESEIGWFTYLGEKNILNILPDYIYKEELENGTLFLLSKDIPDVSNRETEYKIKEIRKSLMKKNLLNIKNHINK
ncbi:hypothetical protein FACS189426_22740 [Bacteroidia bacterium]|nr:hypothetical protein FACS189426_22740 [Bacteroidia bacterium]